jgi:hypothetical protein
MSAPLPISQPVGYCRYAAELPSPREPVFSLTSSEDLSRPLEQRNAGLRLFLSVIRRIVPSRTLKGPRHPTKRAVSTPCRPNNTTTGPSRGSRSRMRNVSENNIACQV